MEMSLAWGVQNRIVLAVSSPAACVLHHTRLARPTPTRRRYPVSEARIRVQAIHAGLRAAFAAADEAAGSLSALVGGGLQSVSPDRDEEGYVRHLVASGVLREDDWRASPRADSTWRWQWSPEESLLQIMKSWSSSGKTIQDRVWINLERGHCFLGSSRVAVVPAASGCVPFERWMGVRRCVHCGRPCPGR